MFRAMRRYLQDVVGLATIRSEASRGYSDDVARVGTSTRMTYRCTLEKVDSAAARNRAPGKSVQEATGQ